MSLPKHPDVRCCNNKSGARYICLQSVKRRKGIVNQPRDCGFFVQNQSLRALNEVFFPRRVFFLIIVGS